MHNACLKFLGELATFSVLNHTPFAAKWNRMNPILAKAPRWLLRPLPAFSEPNLELENKVLQLCSELPQEIHSITRLLGRSYGDPGFESAVNLANANLWHSIDQIMQTPEHAKLFCNHCQKFFPHAGISRVIRRMLVHGRNAAYGIRLLRDSAHQETSIQPVRYHASATALWTDPRKRRHAGSSQRRKEVGVPDIATVKDLRELLHIRSAKQLGYLLSANTQKGGPYTTFEIAKRSGGSRLICAPCGSLLWVQRRLNREILSKIQIDDAAHGFVRGRSTVTNAQPHVGASLILKFDLREFFPTIHQHRILGLFRAMGYHVGHGRYMTDDRSRDIAPVLARLCVVTHNRNQPGVLPQGAPTSPAISNLICRRLDQRLMGLAEKFGGQYTRYADDLTFSFSEDILVGKFRWWVDQICFREGFTVRQDKFRAIRASQQQNVTGIVVNQRMNVSRRERRKFRAILHQCRLNGVEEQAKKHPGIQGYMRGFAAYINMVDPQDNGAMLKAVADILGDDK